MSQTQNSQERKYVVLHKGISGLGGGFAQGAVITAAQIGETNIGRMLSLQAIREASADEAKLKEVTVDPNDRNRNRSTEQQLAEALRANEALVKRNGELEDRVGVLERQLAEKAGAAAAGDGAGQQQQGQGQQGRK